jgi:hypothetical protein|tara:strand:- start:714 stop:959 length:246 start_codon:yes stop_codon:yes gene_type:complete
MDGRKNNGGHSNGGRKPKAEEVKLIERLTPLEPQAYTALKKGIERGEFKFIQMFYHYYAGKPRETKDITLNTEQPLFNIID